MRGCDVSSDTIGWTEPRDDPGYGDGIEGLRLGTTASAGRSWLAQREASPREPRATSEAPSRVSVQTRAATDTQLHAADRAGTPEVQQGSESERTFDHRAVGLRRRTDGVEISAR